MKSEEELKYFPRNNPMAVFEEGRKKAFWNGKIVTINELADSGLVS